ncbi:MAG: hypothetical protein ACYTG2_15875 [Planctomycetota bacterium]|jgi:hypothetical protein
MDRPTEGPASGDTGPAPRRPAGLLVRPWFWVAIVALGFAIPLLKSIGRELPPPLPGQDGPALVLSLHDESGALRQLDELRGRIVIVTALSLANATEREATFDSLRVLQKRLRGLTPVLGWAVLCPGGSAAELAALLDAKKARRPYHLYLLDEGGAGMDRLCAESGSPSARLLLLDRHGRARGTYGDGEDEIDRLVAHAGELANWPGQDL